MVQVIRPRLNSFARWTLVDRVFRGRPVAHVAAEMGVSRQTAYRWVRRFQTEGVAGLADRSSRPLRSPTRTSRERERAVLEARSELRQGPIRIAEVTGVPARTVGRILARHGVPRLSICDPITGQVIRTSHQTTTRYERARPGELVHVDVKKLGRIPDGGGWRAHGGTLLIHDSHINRSRVGYDFIHAMVDDCTRLAYAEIHPDEKGVTVAGFLTRAAAYFADHGITGIERVMTDNAYAYRNSHVVADVLATLGARHVFIRPRCPWQNGKVERFNRTLATEWAYRRPYYSNQQRADALAPWIHHYNTERIHTAHWSTPATRVSTTS